MRSAASRAARATCLSAFLLLGGAPLALAQGRADSGSASAVPAILQVPADSVAQAPTQEGLGSHTHRASQELNHLRPVLEWSWGAVGATTLALCGAILFVLPVALVYRRTKGQHEYDPGVTHSSIILAPTIAGVLMVIQGSLAMAWQLEGSTAGTSGGQATLTYLVHRRKRTNREQLVRHLEAVARSADFEVNFHP